MMSLPRRRRGRLVALLVLSVVPIPAIGFISPLLRSLGRPSALLLEATPLHTATSVSFHQQNVPIDKQIVKLGRQGLTNAALELYQSLDRPTIRQSNAAMDACARARPVRIEEAFQILTHLTTPSNVYTFGALMSACARAGDVDRALRLLSKMKTDYNVAPNGVVYNSAISAAARAAQPDKAMQLLQQARQDGVKLTVVGYNAAVSAAAAQGNVDLADTLLTQMTSGDPDVPVADAVTYGTVLAACERAQDWERLLDYANRMKDAGLAPDGIALTSILHACQQLGRGQEAAAYLEQMKDCAQPERWTAGWKYAGSKQPLQGPDAVAYRLAISACARGGDWREGIRLLDDYCAEGNDNDVVAYTAAITGCEYAGEWKQAFVLLDRMRQKGVEPNEVTFAAIMGACATATAQLVASGRVNIDYSDPKSFPLPQRKALQLLSVLRKDESILNPNVPIYNAAIRTCAEAMDLKRALALLDNLRLDGLEPNIVTYGSLMTACERIGSTDGVSQVFKMMRDDECEPNEIIYGAAISCCRKAGESERAVLLLKKMVRDGLKPNVAVFNTVLMALSESRNDASMIDNMLVVYKILQSKQYSSARPNRQTYNILIRAFAVAREPRQAEVFLQAMQKEGLFPDVDLFTATISAYERLGQPLKALALMESMRERGYDFYESGVLNAAFKKAVKLANAVGRGLSLDHGRNETVGFSNSTDFLLDGEGL